MNILYKIVKQQKSTDNGRTWIDTGNKKVGGILEYDSDCGNTESGDTTECSDVLSFEYNMNEMNDLQYSINWGTAYDTTYEVSESPYTTTFNGNLTSTAYMFEGCDHLTNVTSIPCTNNVTNMARMFSECESLTSLNLDYFDTSKVTDMGGMFSRCTNLQTLNVTGWDISKVTVYEYLFNRCDSLSKLILGDVTQETYNWWCARLTDADISCDIIEYSINSECTPSITYSNYNLISVEVMDENNNSLGIFDANGSNTIDTNITVEYNKDIKIKEVIFSRQATTVKTDCTTTTTTETPSLFILPYSISPAENTTSNTQKATITFNIEDELTCYVTFYRSGK